MSYLIVTDGDVGLLVKAMHANGGGARGSKSSMKRLVESGMAEWKGLNHQTNNESIFGPRINCTEIGKKYILTGVYNVP